MSKHKTTDDRTVEVAWGFEDNRVEIYIYSAKKPGATRTCTTRLAFNRKEAKFLGDSIASQTFDLDQSAEKRYELDKPKPVPATPATNGKVPAAV